MSHETQNFAKIADVLREAAKKLYTLHIYTGRNISTYLTTYAQYLLKNPKIRYFLPLDTLWPGSLDPLNTFLTTYNVTRQIFS